MARTLRSITLGDGKRAKLTEEEASAVIASQRTFKNEEELKSFLGSHKDITDSGLSRNSIIHRVCGRLGIPLPGATEAVAAHQ